MDNLLRKYEEQQAKRPVYIFDLPEEAQALDDEYIKKSIGLRKLTMQEELQALEMAHNKPAHAAFYMLVTSLVEVDGRAVNKGDGEDERIVNNADPMIRSLLVDAQASLSGPTNVSKDAFLKSRRVKVG